MTVITGLDPVIHLFRKKHVTKMACAKWRIPE